MSDQNSKSRASYDISIVRPQLKHDDFKMRGRDMEPARLQAIRKGLLTLHTLELMAATIYKFQITSEKSQLNQDLIAAMCNEMTHYQDFQVKLYEYGFRPSLIRWAYWIVGFTFGFGSRVFGTKAILKMGIWVETKAVHHYAQLLEAIDWDEETRKVIEKDQADEDGHINKWRTLLGQIK
jgi:ubiquinone biosynthesis monooxygenase Coq7